MSSRSESTGFSATSSPSRNRSRRGRHRESPMTLLSSSSTVHSWRMGLRRRNIWRIEYTNSTSTLRSRSLLRERCGVCPTRSPALSRALIRSPNSRRPQSLGRFLSLPPLPLTEPSQPSLWISDAGKTKGIRACVLIHRPLPQQHAQTTPAPQHRLSPSDVEGMIYLVHYDRPLHHAQRCSRDNCCFLG